MNLDIAEWKPFTVGELFHIINGAGITQDEIESNPGTLTAVQSGEEDNGCIGKIDRGYCVSMGYKICDGPCLTVARSGSAGYVAYQPDGCVVGDSAKILLLKDEDARTVETYLFFETLLTANRYKYDYGRKVTAKKYSDEVLMVPVNADGSPDYEFITEFMQTLKNKPVTTVNTPDQSPVDTASWEYFLLDDLFEIKKGKRLTAADQTEGDTPYVGAIESNNGIANHIGQAAIHEGNTISLSYNGSVGEAFYQPDPFWATDDVNVLYFRDSNGVDFNEYIALFICAVLRQEQFKFSYGRKWTLENMRATKIKLPAKDGRPDWEFMEGYIQSLPYGDRISLH